MKMDFLLYLLPGPYGETISFLPLVLSTAASDSLGAVGPLGTGDVCVNPLEMLLLPNLGYDGKTYR